MKNNTSRPIGILLISGYYIFGAIILVSMYITHKAEAAIQIASRHGLPDTTGSWILLVVACVGLVMAVGLLSLSRWGYVFAMIYLGYFFIANLNQFNTGKETISVWNLVFSVMVIIYLLYVLRKFFPGR